MIQVFSLCIITENGVLHKQGLIKTQTRFTDDLKSCQIS
jgi:hypothetical protein